MDRLLRPKVLEIETTTPNAEKLYRHWKITFENFLESSIPPAPEGIEGDNARATAERRKHHALINNVSATIYELISDSATYQEAMALLDTAFIRPTSVVYNRHQLITTKQDVGQSIDTYLQNLQRIAKTCNFTAVTAEENKNQYVRDAFINGISSASIRQRLLRNIGELTLQQACTQARALEQAQNQSAAYKSPSSQGALGAIQETETGQIAATGQKSKTPKSNTYTKGAGNSGKQACYFCGHPRHNRSVCPARDAECMACKKKGHWSNVCRSKNAIGSIGQIPLSSSTQYAIPQQDPQQYSHQQAQIPAYNQQYYQPPFLQQNQAQPLTLPSDQTPSLA